MKFQPDTLPGVNVITRHDAGQVWVGATTYAHSVLVPWRGDVRRWDVAHFDSLAETHFAGLVAMQPELVIFGSGRRLRFPRPPWLRSLIEARIGFETMDTAAACRTYNVLASEGRDVLAALLIEAPGTGGSTL
jgi:uncharacterized protein